MPTIDPMLDRLVRLESIVADLSGLDRAAGDQELTTFTGADTTRKVYRTDRNIRYYYDTTNAQWLSVNEMPFNFSSVFQLKPTTGYATAGIIGMGPLYGTYQVWISRIVLIRETVTTNDASNYWGISFDTLNSAGTATNRYGITTAALAPDTYNQLVTTLAAVNQPAITDYSLQWSISKTGAPGAFKGGLSLWHRLVG